MAVRERIWPKMLILRKVSFNQLALTRRWQGNPARAKAGATTKHPQEECIPNKPWDQALRYGLALPHLCLSMQSPVSASEQRRYLDWHCQHSEHLVETASTASACTSVLPFDLVNPMAFPLLS